MYSNASAWINNTTSGSLKALRHAIRADSLLIEVQATRVHAENEQWAWQMADKFVCMFKPTR